MPFCIHTLNVRLIISALRIIDRRLRMVRADGTAGKQTNTGTNSRALMSAKRHTGHRTDGGPKHRRSCNVFIGSLR